MSGPESRAVAGLLVCAYLASGCFVNPVSGMPELSVTSPEQEVEIGREAAKQVEAELGIVAQSPLTAYVAAVGQRVARHSPRQDVSYRFQIVDVPEPNAFALPGGYVYISRGILALANSEPELAGVLAHEIAHVAARHAAQRQTRAVGVGILALPGLLAGSLVGGPLGQAIAAPFAAAGMGALASYSRGQEQEADRIGQELAARAGEDPAGLATFLTTLERYERLRGDGRIPGFFDTHPLTPERARRTAERVAQLPWQPSDEVLARSAFLRRIDGLLVGENPAQGVFEGPRFLHPELDFTVLFPEGWETANTASAVGAVTERRDAQVVLEIQSRGNDARAAGRALLDELARGTRIRILEETTVVIAGRSAYRVRLLAAARGGDVGVDVTWIPYRETIYRVAGTAPAAAFDGTRATFGGVAQSFRPLSDAERAGIREDRLRITEARRGESLAGLRGRTGSAWSAEEIAVANQLSGDAALGAGELVKIAVQEPLR